MAPATAGAVFVWSRLRQLRRLRIEPSRAMARVKIQGIFWVSAFRCGSSQEDVRRLAAASPMSGPLLFRPALKSCYCPEPSSEATATRCGPLL
jgi:hypothetical protein